MAFPTAVTTFSSASGTETLGLLGSGTGLAPMLNVLGTDLNAVETKLGTGATTPAANQLLFGTGSGTSAWQALTSANLAAVISDETGSGALVFANSPTIVTPTIASFTNATHDHSNNAGGGGSISPTTLTTNTINASGANHIALSAGTSKLVKLTVLRQDDTTNTYQVGNSVMLTGWGVMTPGVAAQANETVTFGVTFTQRPIVVITAGGDAVAATTYGSGGDNIKDGIVFKAHTITTTNFVAKFISRDASNFGAGNTVFYQWIAIGEI